MHHNYILLCIGVWHFLPYKNRVSNECCVLEYSSESLSVCVRPFLCVSFCTMNQNNRTRSMKLEYIVVYENSWDKFGIEHCRMKVKVTVGLKNFQHLSQYKLSGPISQLCAQAWKLILSMYVHLIIVCEILEYCHA